MTRPSLAALAADSGAQGVPPGLGMLLPRPPLLGRNTGLLLSGQARGIEILKRIPAAGCEGGCCAVRRRLRRSPAEFRSPPPAPRGASASWATGRGVCLFLPVPLCAAAPRRPPATGTLSHAPGGAAPPAAAKLPARSRPARFPGAPGASCGPQRPGRPLGARRGGAGLAGGVGSAARVPFSALAPARLRQEAPRLSGKMDASCGQPQPGLARRAGRPWATPPAPPGTCN